MAEEIKEDIEKKESLPSEDEKKENPQPAVEKPEKKEKEQDPLKAELDKVQQKEGGRTKREKLIYTKKRIESQLRELDEDEGIEPEEEEEDEEDVPNWYKKEKAKETVKTAIDLADDIESDTERELVKYHIENTIKSSGNAKKDLAMARAIVNAAKNKMILEEQARKTSKKEHSSSGGAPAPRTEQEEELTKEELSFMKAPFNLTKAQVLEARKKNEKNLQR